MKKQLLVILVLAVVAVVLNLTACSDTTHFEHETTGLPFNADPAAVPSEVTCYEFVKIELPLCNYNVPDNRNGTTGEDCTEAEMAVLQEARDIVDKIGEIRENEEFVTEEFVEERDIIATFDLDEFDYILIREIEYASDINVKEGCYIYPASTNDTRPVAKSSNGEE